MRFHRLDLNHLVTLEMLLSERSVTRAAERLNLTQPAISNALTRLREHFDDDLLVRHGREMVCTPFADEILSSLRETLTQLRSIALAKPGFDPASAVRTFSIVASDYFATVFLGDLISRVSSVAPHVKILHVPLSADAIGGFDRGESDMVIFPKGTYDLKNIHQEQLLYRENFICIAREGASVPDNITSGDFAKLKRVNPFYKEFVIDAQWKELHLGEMCDAISLPFSAIPWFVAKSDYVAMLPERFLALYEPFLPLRRVKLGFELPPVEFQVQWQREKSKDAGTQWLLERLGEVAEDLERGIAPPTHLRVIDGAHGA